MTSRGGMGFQTMPCGRCGSVRLLGVACDDCGQQPPTGEVNAPVVRRRSAVRQVDELVAKHVAILGSVPDYSEISRAVTSFSSAVTRFAEDSNPRFVEALARAVSNFADLHARSEASELFRPNIARRTALVTTTERLVELWPLYRATLTAPSIREVQRLNAVAQRALDTCTNSLDTYRDRAKALIPLGGDARKTLRERALSSLTTSYAGTLLDIAAVGAEQAGKLTGHSVRPGAGAQFLVQSSVASVWLDNDRFERVITESSKLCRTADFSAVLQSGRALDGIAASQRRLAEAVLAFEAVLSGETDEHTIFRRLLKYHAEVYEEVGGPLFAWYLLLAGVKTKPYEKLIKEGATALAKSIDARPDLASWFDGREAFIRNAASHVGGFDIEDQVVNVTLGSTQVSHSIGWFVDRIYAFLESTMATSWSLLNELERRGISIPFSKADQRYLGITTFETAAMFAKMSFGAIECLENGGDWMFSLPPGEDDVMLKAMTLVAGDPEVRSVSVRRLDATTTLRVPLEAWERHVVAARDLGDAECVTALVEFRAACTVDGVPLLREADVQPAVGLLGIRFMAGGLELSAALRRLSQISMDRGYIDTHDRIVRVLRTLRTRDAREQKRLTNELSAWLTGSLAMPKASSVVVFRAASPLPV